MPLSSILLGGKYKDLASFFTPVYLIAFLPVCLFLYSLMPRSFKKYFLLAVSCAFFWFISGKLIVYLILSTVSVYCFGLLLNRMQNKMQTILAATSGEDKKAVKAKLRMQQRLVVFLAVVLLLGVLLTLKYSTFFATNINTVFSHYHVTFKFRISKHILPIGISFFTLQAISYILDVYNGVTKADANIFRLALFIAFFPQIVEGPICRYNQTAKQLWDVKPIQYSNMTLGSQRILFGAMKKIVVADRLNILVNNVFLNYADYRGGIIAFAAVCYTIQLYMDFSGAMDVAIGTAQIFGIGMPENFQRPFFSKTISEFWKRWHITLGTWFKDYVFYPITSAKKMKKLTSSARKKIGNHYGPLIAGSVALFCVWICNGLWHGSAWSFIFFGMYHFALILCGNIIAPPVKWINKKLKINSEWFGYRFFQMLRTAVLVVIGELFFRAHGLRAGLEMFKIMVSDFYFSFSNELLVKLGIDKFDVVIVCITLLIVLFVSIANEKNISVRDYLANKNIALRWAVLYALIIFIVVFGAYGRGYVPVDPIYAQF